MSAKYWIAQYIADVFRKEPRNIGVIVQLAEDTTSRFFGVSGEGKIDGRKTQGFKYPDVYRQWVQFWQSELKTSGPDRCMEANASHYRIISGGSVDDIDASSIDEVANYLFAVLVSPGGLIEALDGPGAVDRTETAFADVVAEAFTDQSILEANQPLLVRHPIRRNVPVVGKIGVAHKPSFVQQNGSLAIIEVVDFSIPQKRFARDHAGWTAFMIGDLQGTHPDLEPFAVVKTGETVGEEVRNGLVILENKATVVDWQNDSERNAFIESRREKATG